MATRRRSSAAAATERPARGGRGAAAKTQSRGSSGFRGAAGAKRAEAEKTKQDTRRQQARDQATTPLKPFRLYLKSGDTKEIVILDDALEDLFFTYEHNLKNPQSGYWDIYTGCTKENQVCPVCEGTNRESYYALMLSVIDFTPYTDRKGVEHEFSRKLMCVKPAQIGKFLRFVKKKGTLRGAVFELSRDGDSDPQIGNDIEFVEFMEEDELSSYERTWEDREGKLHTEDCSEVYDYDALFPAVTNEELAKFVGGGAAVAGSSREAEEELDDDMEADEDLEDEDQDDTPWDAEEKAPARTRRSTSRSSTGGRASSAKGRSRRAPVDEDEEEEEEVYDDEVVEDEEVEEAPAPRRGRRGAAAAEAKPRGRAAGRRAGRSRR